MTPEQKQLNEQWGKLEGWGKAGKENDFWTSPKDKDCFSTELPNWAGDATLFFAEVVPRMRVLGFDWRVDSHMLGKQFTWFRDLVYIETLIVRDNISTAGLASAIEARKALEATQ